MTSELISAGDALFKKNNYKGAIAKYELARFKNNNQDAPLRLSHAYAALNDFHESLKWMKLALLTNDLTEEIFWRTLKLMRATNSHAEAEDLIGRFFLKNEKPLLELPDASDNLTAPLENAFMNKNFKEFDTLLSSLAKQRTSIDRKLTFSQGLMTAVIDRVEEQAAQNVKSPGAFCIKLYDLSADPLFLNLAAQFENTDSKSGYLRRLVDSHPTFSHGWNTMGLYFQKNQIKVEAELCYLKALALRPSVAEFNYNAGKLYFMINKLDRARHYLNRVKSGNEVFNVASQMLAAMGDDIDRTSRSSELMYAELLFDSYANNFDASLEKLKYNTPQLILEMVKPHISEAKLKIVDLGCGTGLVGNAFKDHIQIIVGSDISEQMLSKAKERDIYSELLKLDILSHLQSLDGQWDLAVASDVFNYIKDIRAILKTAKVEGKIKFFAFDIEINTQNSDEVYLQETGRYCHSVKAVEKIITEMEIDIKDSKETILQKNNNEAVKGQLFLAEFS